MISLSNGNPDEHTGQKVLVTLLSAAHCPGSVMWVFLYFALPLNCDIYAVIEVYMAASLEIIFNKIK